MKVSLGCILIRVKSVTSTPTRTESDTTGKEESPTTTKLLLYTRYV